jgi:adenylate cyclase
LPRDNPVVVGITQAAGDPSGEELVREIVQRRLAWVGWGANLAGILVVSASILFLIPVFLDPGQRADFVWLNAPFVLPYYLLVGFGITRHFNRLTGALEWIAEGRPPDEREHRLALGLAVREVKLSALGWLGAGILFSVLNAVAFSWGFAAVVGATIWLGGETTCALDYLAAERILRPITARALAARETDGSRGPGVRERLLWAWALGTGVPLVGVVVVGIVGVTKSGVSSDYIGAAVLFLGVVASAAGLLATLFAAKAIADPVTSVRVGLEQVEQGDLEVHVQVDDGSEVGLLQAGFNRMAEGLREREQIRDLFGRHVGREVARSALREGTRLGGEERQIGVLFVDLVSSSSMSLAMPPTEVVRVLNLFFRAVVETVENHRGLVNKFEGDGALCVFGAPIASEDPAGDALRAARELANRLPRDVPQVDFGIGVSAGLAVAGNVGAEQRFEYTVIGDPVNEAARLCELAKQQPERVLSTEAALRGTRGDESSAWRGEKARALRGRTGRTGVAVPRTHG